MANIAKYTLFTKCSIWKKQIYWSGLWQFILLCYHPVICAMEKFSVLILILVLLNVQKFCRWHLISRSGRDLVLQKVQSISIYILLLFSSFFEFFFAGNAFLSVCRFPLFCWKFTVDVVFGWVLLLVSMIVDTGWQLFLLLASVVSKIGLLLGQHIAFRGWVGCYVIVYHICCVRYHG